MAGYDTRLMPRAALSMGSEAESKVLPASRGMENLEGREATAMKHASWGGMKSPNGTVDPTDSFSERLSGIPLSCCITRPHVGNQMQERLVGQQDRIACANAE